MKEPKYSPQGNKLIAVKNTVLFSDCYYCPSEDKIYEETLTEVRRERFSNFSSDRFEEIKQLALIKEARNKVSKTDLKKLGYL